MNIFSISSQISLGCRLLINDRLIDSENNRITTIFHAFSFIVLPNFSKHSKQYIYISSISLNLWINSSQVDFYSYSPKSALQLANQRWRQHICFSSLVDEIHIILKKLLFLRKKQSENKQRCRKKKKNPANSHIFKTGTCVNPIFCLINDFSI